MTTSPDARPLQRRIFCNRTLNLRSIRAVGYDMDYTLIHSNVEQWERRAFKYLKRKLLERGWPVEDTQFNPLSIDRGLIIDLEEGNIVKANRFGYVKTACHGTRMLGYKDKRKLYGRRALELGGPRWRFLNTSFSVSEGCMYRLLVDMLDEGLLSEVMGYEHLYRIVRRSLDEAHMEGKLKADIIASPERFIELDPDTPLALLDQKRAGKKVMLITNSGWAYSQVMMDYAFNPFLPDGMVWRDLFDIVIVAARKPLFFSDSQSCFELIDEDKGLLQPFRGDFQSGRVYHGGHAGLIEETLGLSGKDILYVGDHVYGDVHASKSVRRWRTALVVRELEDELTALDSHQRRQEELHRKMDVKVALEAELSMLRLQLQRKKQGYGPQPEESVEALQALFTATREKTIALDQAIAPLAIEASALVNPEWGLLMRAGNDKSYIARVLERHADIYTSRVSNFLWETPFSFLRSPRGSLPHDPDTSFNPYASSTNGDD